MAERPKPIVRKGRVKPTDTRPNAADRGYAADWQRVRLAVLCDEPLCRPCRAAGRVTEATLVDHVTPLSEGGARLDRSNLEPMCVGCHARKTARDKARRRNHYS